MQMIEVLARAKINIALDVLGKRDDGYHELRGVMQSIALADVISLKRVKKNNYLKLISNVSHLPIDQRNIAFKAAKTIIDKYNIQDGVFIDLIKNIPVSAGLGGGSADCAAVLVGMNRLFELNIPFDELLDIGLSMGADVPFCLTGGTCLAEGIGERLTSLRHMPQAFILLVKPAVPVSTAEVFKHFNPGTAVKPDIDKLIYYIEKADLQGICSQMANVLESVTAAWHPEISEIKEKMLECGALGAVMSGSGPTVIGVFDDNQVMQGAGKVIMLAFPDVNDVIMTRTYEKFM
jgi:4-diphosphocytidyl-2-C-methyl-D-erythritol kinase